MAAAFAQMENIDKAHGALEIFLREAGPDPWWKQVPQSAEAVESDPTGLLTYMNYMYPFKNPTDLDHLLDGLRKAGLPQ